MARGRAKCLTVTGKDNGRILEGGETILYFDRSRGYLTVCICQNSQNCMLKQVNFAVST